MNYFLAAVFVVATSLQLSTACDCGGKESNFLYKKLPDCCCPQSCSQCELPCCYNPCPPIITPCCEPCMPPLPQCPCSYIYLYPYPYPYSYPCQPTPQPPCCPLPYSPCHCSYPIPSCQILSSCHNNCPPPSCCEPVHRCLRGPSQHCCNKHCHRSIDCCH